MEEQAPILIISGTNRPNSLTLTVARYYADMLKNKSVSANILDLSIVSTDFIFTGLYSNKNEPFNLAKIQIEQVLKYIFIIPDYNGSFPGILKAFIDGLAFPGTFLNKKYTMVGMSKGIRGGILALSHLTNVSHYLKMYVHTIRLTLSNIVDSKLETVLANNLYVNLLQEREESFINF